MKSQERLVGIGGLRKRAGDFLDRHPVSTNILVLAAAFALSAWRVSYDSQKKIFGGPGVGEDSSAAVSTDTGEDVRVAEEKR